MRHDGLADLFPGLLAMRNPFSLVLRNGRAVSVTECLIGTREPITILPMVAH